MILAKIYALIINLIAFTVCGIDKSRSKKRGEWRIPEKTLFLLAILGGSLGMLLGMCIFRHKTKHWYFKIGIPAILLAQVAIVVFAIYQNSMI